MVRCFFRICSRYFALTLAFFMCAWLIMIEMNGYQSTDAFIEEMERRKETVNEVCKKYGLGKYATSTSSNPFHYSGEIHWNMFMYNKKHNLLWCQIYKAASTSWKYNMCLLGGENKTKLNNVDIRFLGAYHCPSDYVSSSNEGQVLSDAVKFLIARHPFERLLSAYRDKLENRTEPGMEGTQERFYQMYGKKIAQKYSNNTSNNKEPDFKEFVRYLIDALRNYTTSIVDVHWLFYHFSCAPCNLDYDFILKTDTLDRDSRYLIDKMALGKQIQPTHHRVTKGVLTSNVVRKYYETLTKRQVLDLYDMYKLDFELFGYDPIQYLKWAKG